jgi:hypothetical protein
MSSRVTRYQANRKSDRSKSWIASRSKNVGSRSEPRQFDRSEPWRDQLRANRSGMTMVMFLGSVMVLASLALYRTSQTQKLALNCIRHTKLLDDLHERFMLDSRSSIKFSFDNDAMQFINPQGQTIEYRQDDSAVVRQVKSTDDKTVTKNSWKIGCRGLNAQLDSTGITALVKLNLTIDRLSMVTPLGSSPQEKQSASSEPSDEASKETSLESFNWTCRLGVEQ